MKSFFLLLTSCLLVFQFGCATLSQRRLAGDDAEVYHQSLDPFAGLASTSAGPSHDVRTYSKTQGDFDNRLKPFLDPAKSKYLTVAEIKSIELDPPPANNSERTQAEIAFLFNLRSAQSSIIEDRLFAENFFNHVRFGPVFINARHVQEIDSSDAVDTLISEAIADFNYELYYQKAKFDRIRPSYLNRALQPLLRVPRHPAYPSGHSSQAYLIAELLSRLDPTNAIAYFQAAKEIAVGREIAGLHYPSDSESGRVLAQKYAELLLTKPAVADFYEAARVAWKRRPANARILIIEP